ncbi:MAG: SDR family oxidoreductase [Hyphomicrobiales bacterium]|nr:MAG: SDR family oxidoreductase [Hyphomicrobiales bacterium]
MYVTLSIMNLGIQGKRAIIIGGTSGIGAACAHALAAEGANLALVARSEDNLQRAGRELMQSFDVGVDTHSVDITNVDSVFRLTEEIRRSGGADILILNTPRPPSPMRDLLDENDNQRWETAYREQLHGALNVLRSIVPVITPKGWGRVIGITSASVKQPMPRHAISSIFRAGVQAALKHLSLEVAAHGVTVNAVAPATIITPTFEQFHDVQSRVSLTPLKRAGTLEELAGTVAFLASQQAGYITGELIQVDGGRTSSLV